MGAATKTPIDVVCLVLTDGQDRVYTTRRPPGKALAGFWEFPGGKVDPGEALESALQREISEELGVEVIVGAALTPVEHPYPFGAVRLLPFFGRLRGDSPGIHLQEHTEGRWVSLAEARLLDWAPADVPILAELDDLENGRPSPR